MASPIRGTVEGNGQSNWAYGYDRLAAEGLLGPDHNLVHCQLLTDDELRRILDTGASITSTC